MDNSKSVSVYVNAAIIMSKFRDRVRHYDRLVTDAGHGYVLGDDLTRLLNMCPWREAEEAVELITKIEKASGVDFPWGKFE